MIRLDSLSSGAVNRLIIAVNGNVPTGNSGTNTGLEAIEGDGGSTSQRTLIVTGTLKLTKKDYVSAFVYSSVRISALYPVALTNMCSMTKFVGFALDDAEILLQIQICTNLFTLA